MKTVKIMIGLMACLTLSFHACKKAEENSQEIVQQHILGAWPIKYHIKTTLTGNIETKADTLAIYNPIDTLVFTAEGKAIRRNKTVISTVDYSISADGENITFASSPAVTQKIIFLRIKSIGLGTETTSQVSGQEITTQIADHLIK